VTQPGQGAIWFIDAAWAAWLILWIAMAPWVKPTATRESVARRAAHILPLLLAASVVFFCPAGQGWWTCRNLLHPAAWMAPTGAAMVAVGLGFAVWARFVLAENWSGIVTLKQDHTLICNGPYAIVRHPIYTGLLGALLGTAIAIDQWRGVLALGIVAASFIAKSRTEEAFMMRAFGEAYAQYRVRVAGLIPFIW